MHPFFSRFHHHHGFAPRRDCQPGAGRRHRGFGAFFRDGDGAQGFGPGGFRAGRKLSGDSLQLLILALLADKPRHGYEIIKELGERSGGFYTPSPGMVYPALTFLEETGLAEVAAEGTKKLYSITADGRAHLDAHRAEADAMLQQLTWLAERMDSVRDAVEDDAVDGTAAPRGRRGLLCGVRRNPRRAPRTAPRVRRAAARSRHAGRSAAHRADSARRRARHPRRRQPR